MNPQKHDYCPLCGTETEKVEKEGRERDYCPKHQEIVYRTSALWAGVAVTTKNNILLVKRANEPSKNKWSIPAGFLDIGEKPRRGATRELKEETGIDVMGDQLSLLQNLKHTHPDGTQTVGMIYGIEVSESGQEPEPSDDALKAEFTSPEQKELAHIAQRIDYRKIRDSIENKIDIRTKKNLDDPR